MRQCDQSTQHNPRPGHLNYIIDSGWQMGASVLSPAPKLTCYVTLSKRIYLFRPQSLICASHWYSECLWSNDRLCSSETPRGRRRYGDWACNPSSCLPFAYLHHHASVFYLTCTKVAGSLKPSVRSKAPSWAVLSFCMLSHPSTLTLFLPIMPCPICSFSKMSRVFDPQGHEKPISASSECLLTFVYASVIGVMGVIY